MTKQPLHFGIAETFVAAPKPVQPTKPTGASIVAAIRSGK
jgi:hypothetical protein